MFVPYGKNDPFKPSHGAGDRAVYSQVRQGTGALPAHGWLPRSPPAEAEMGGGWVGDG